MQHNGSTLPRDISTMVDATNTHALRLYAEGAADPLGRALAACPVSKEDPTLVPLDLFSVILASLLIGVGMAVSIWLRLRLEVKLLVAAVRCVVQLSILGWILLPIFQHNTWYVVTAYASFMLLVAAAEAAARPSYAYKGLFLVVLLSLGSCATFTLSYALMVIIHVPVWYDARYFIPLLGMLLGNAVSGVSVGLATVMEELSSGKDRVEIMLALGATRMEAARSVLQRSLLVALTPVLNQLSVVGIVSIPGMMTGQILIMIMFLVSASTAIGSTVAVLGTMLAVIDRQHRLRSERLVQHSGKPKGLNGAINAGVQRALDAVVAACGAVVGGVRGVWRRCFGAGEQPGEEEQQRLLTVRSSSAGPVSLN